jgi:hypothetical protein
MIASKHKKYEKLNAFICFIRNIYRGNEQLFRA